jgi:hypothetical protein
MKFNDALRLASDDPEPAHCLEPSCFPKNKPARSSGKLPVYTTAILDTVLVNRIMVFSATGSSGNPMYR